MKTFRQLALAGTMLAVAGSAAFAEEIKVGSVAGVTGPIAELVVAIVAARQFAADEVNANGGLLDGDTMAMVIADSQCDPKAAVDAGNKVVNVEQVVAIVGAICSGATNGMVQAVTIPAGVVALSDASATPSLTGLDDNDLVFRVAASSAYQGVAMAQLAWDTGYRNLAMTFASDDYNSALAGVFEASFTALGGTISANQMHEPDKASYRSELSTLAGGDAEALAIFAYYGSSGIAVLRNAIEGGLFETFLAADGMFDDSVIEQIGADVLRGNITILKQTPDYESTSYQAFAEAFEATGHGPQGPFVAHGYDAAFLIALAIEKAGSADRSAISAALREVANPPGMVIQPGEWAKAKAAIAAGQDINYEGAAGPNDFDENGDVTGRFSVNVIGDDGKWMVAGAN